MHVEHCDFCKAENYIDAGDPSDFTSTIGDGYACQCWRCGKRFWRISNEEKEDLGLEGDDLDLELTDCENGRPAPDYHSLYYEAFLNSSCEQGGTWRQFLCLQVSPIGVLPFAYYAPEIRKEKIEMFMHRFKTVAWRQVAADAFRHDLKLRPGAKEEEMLHGLHWQRGPDADTRIDQNMQGLLEYMFGAR